MATPNYQKISWVANDVITADKLNAMVHNDDFLNEMKVDGVLKNVDPVSHKPVAGAELLKANLIMYAGYENFSPPEVFDPDNPSYQGTTLDRFNIDIVFPTGLFSPTYQPVVHAMFGYHNGTQKVIMSFNEINFSGFTITLVRADTGTLWDSAQQYFVTYLAMGVSGGLIQ